MGQETFDHLLLYTVGLACNLLMNQDHLSCARYGQNLLTFRPSLYFDGNHLHLLTAFCQFLGKFNFSLNFFVVSDQRRSRLIEVKGFLPPSSSPLRLFLRLFLFVRGGTNSLPVGFIKLSDGIIASGCCV